MKYLLAVLFFFASCAQSQKPTKEQRSGAEFYNFGVHYGKTIQSIEYCKYCGPSGNLLYINFTDGTKLTVYNYKYNLEVVKD